ncbi:MAG: hypothetical protein KIT84_42110, partial [Labilithrix sp.]|nr:hypothetical protein [Labilithrix sp.]
WGGGVFAAAGTVGGARAPGGDGGARGGGGGGAQGGGVHGGGGVSGTIVVPASVVAAAIADKRIGARDAVDVDGKPVGARIHGVSRYKSGLQNGDVIVSVAGSPTPTTTALVEVAMKVVAAGATKLTGKIKRGDAVYDVVLELPPRDK